MSNFLVVLRPATARRLWWADLPKIGLSFSFYKTKHGVYNSCESFSISSELKLVSHGFIQQLHTRQTKNYTSTGMTNEDTHR